MSSPAIQPSLMISLLCRRRPAAPSSLFSPNAVVLVIVVATGGGAGLSVGTKPWQSPALVAIVVISAARHEDQCSSGRHRCIGGEARWRPDKAGSSQPLLPPLTLPPSSWQPLLLLPTPPLQPSVDGWLLCRLLRHLPPNLSSAAFVLIERSSTLSLPAAVPYRQPSPATVL